MKEPLSLRVSDEEDPTRGAKFEAVLKRKKATPSNVIRALIDAYIESDGKIDFPVELAPKCADGNHCPPRTKRYNGGDHHGQDGRVREREVSSKLGR